MNFSIFSRSGATFLNIAIKVRVWVNYVVKQDR